MSLRRQDGFTLAELMVVLVVGGIILAMSLPGLNRIMTRGSVQSAANLLEGEMRLCRSKAVARDMRAWIYFAPGTNYYWTGDQTRTGTTWGGVTWRGPIYLSNRLIVSNATFGGQNYFFYSPDGRPSVGGGPISGSCIVQSTAGAVSRDTVNLDLSGATWQ
jgi:prepilin-type N-terminal cleavage/methylation domain-containing protein